MIAEGVERREQLDFLEQQGCHLYQGYLYSKPVPLAEFRALLAHSQQRPQPA
jgi:EAL domain-containing protein (putative c-di-GMP-specific phosphodiesterase class I)